MTQNLWLHVSLEDYESHMDHADVQQLTALSHLFKKALQFCTPQSVTVIGIAGGNGLDQIDADITRKIVGIDINPDYLSACRERYSHLSDLDLHCIDICQELPSSLQTDLVHVALVFEHTRLLPALEHTLSVVKKDGLFSVVLQLPGDPGKDVASTGIPSMQTLRSGFTLLDIQEFKQQMRLNGFLSVHSHNQNLPAGKAFWLGIFKRESPPQATT